MKKIQGTSKKHILGGVLLALFSMAICVMVYKAQIEDKLNQNVFCTLMSEHKDNATIVLSAEMSEVTELFECKVPLLREISVECKGENVNSDAVLTMILADADTGEEYYYNEKEISSQVNNGKKIKMKLKTPIKNAQEKHLVLSWRLSNAENTKLLLSANYKPGIVFSFNGDQSNHTNFIYAITYSNCNNLKSLYMILSIMLIVFIEVCYWLIIVKHFLVQRFYVPIAIMLGLIFQGVITVYGVPDEPWHMDTAYKYSNKLLFVKEPDVEGMIYKRKCDVEMGDMLANDLESNSYYQLLHNTLEWKEDKELVAVYYVDSSNLVPGVVYLPTAIGISIGRILKLPALLTFQLGRICNLLVFVFLVWCAVRIIPFGKNMLGMLGLLPIAMQQGASASYDAMITGMILLFTAMCFRLEDSKQSNRKEWVVLGVLAIMIVSVKGGVYSPVLFLMAIPLKDRLRGRMNQRGLYRKLFLFVGICAVVLGLLLIKYMPTIQGILTTFTQNGEGESLYSLQYLVKHPFNALYLFWNTVVETGDTHLRGMLGGMLSWHNIKVNWLFIIVLLIGLLLLVNVEGDSYRGNGKQKMLMVSAGMLSVVLIMASMLFACTTLEATHILGLQGRYYLSLAPLVFLSTSTDMVCVGEEQCGRIWFILMMTELFILLQVVAAVV